MIQDALRCHLCPLRCNELERSARRQVAFFSDRWDDPGDGCLRDSRENRLEFATANHDGPAPITKVCGLARLDDALDAGLRQLLAAG